MRKDVILSLCYSFTPCPTFPLHLKDKGLTFLLLLHCISFKILSYVIILCMSTVITYLGCQIEHIWTQRKQKQLDILWGICLIGSFEVRKDLQLLARSYLLMVAYINGLGRRKLLHFACLPSLFLASSSTLLLRYSFAGIRTHFFRIPR